MLKSAKVVSRKFKWLRLYLDDLQKIVGLMKEYNETAAYRYRANSLESDNFEELIDAIQGDELKDFSMRSFSPYLEFEVDASKANIYLGEETNQSAGLASRIEEILKAREFAFRPRVNGSRSLAMVVAGMLLVAGLKSYNQPIQIQTVAMALVVTGSALFMYSFAATFIDQVKVFKYRSAERSGFFQRNKDQLLLLLFGAFLGSAITQAIAWMIREHGK